jgi:asparagine synthase (glutamine-hydrolysing)
LIAAQTLNRQLFYASLPFDTLMSAATGARREPFRAPMCGIAGEWDWNGAPAPIVIATMIDSLAHRGPEGRACWFGSDGKIALAHSQLSFFKGAKAQPFSNDRSSIFVICNGEIYNHQELAALLRQSGVKLDIRSDIEIIPHLYESRGSSSFSLLRGEFAFALYDGEKRSLYLVRDRIGIKPLYYYLADTAVLFASEIKALFANPRVPRNLDHPTIATKLFGITAPGSTCFSAIREVKPGCYLQVGAGRIVEQPYWSPRLEVVGNSKHLGQLADEFLEIFDEAVRLRLQGDYPIGAYLSGGIDSSAVLASMVHGRAKSLKAFTISFEDRQFDESQAAVDTASWLGVEHHLIRVRNRDIAENFLRSIWHCEIPVINTHGTAKFMLSRAASVHVKAIMTGEGADELFAGYPYFGASDGEHGQIDTRQNLVNWWRLLGSSRIFTGFLPLLRAKDVERLRASFGCAPYVGLRALFYARLIRRLLNPEFLRWFSPRDTLESVGRELQCAKISAMTQTNANRLLALKYDLPAYNLNFLADREEMAHSIEGRLPFLDDNVVAFATALGDEALIADAAGKKLIRMAFAKRLPLKTLASRKKIFLAPPTAVDEILRSEWAPHLLSRTVTDAVGVFDWRKLAWLRAGLKIVPAHSGAGTAMRALWVFVISLHALHDLFVKQGRHALGSHL